MRNTLLNGLLVVCCNSLLFVGLIARPLQAEQEFSGDTFIATEFLVLPAVGRYGRVPLHQDPLQALLARGKWSAPLAGSSVSRFDGKLKTWVAASADSTGWLDGSQIHGGYVFAAVKSAVRRVALLEASGHSMVYVNGVPRSGDPYRSGQTILPIILESGTNTFLLHAASETLRLKLTKPTSDVFLDARDATLPSLDLGEKQPMWAGVLLVNCHEKPLIQSQVTTSIGNGKLLTSKIDPVPPLGVRKVSVPFLPPEREKADTDATLPLEISLTVANASAPASSLSLELTSGELRKPRTCTFLSHLDGSVQSFRLIAAGTAAPDDTESEKPGLVVSLHDTGETSSAHGQSLEPPQGFHYLIPDGRRTAGCDWEDWSATDALEALDHVAELVEYDPQRVYLRGTGTGGHGVLRLAGIAPNRWAAVAATKPWLDYRQSYFSTKASGKVAEMLSRINEASHIAPLLHNTIHCGLILAGEQDSDNSDIKTLRKMLADYHPKIRFLEFTPPTTSTSKSPQPWKTEGELLLAYESPTLEETLEVDLFAYLANSNSRAYWLSILQQVEQGVLSRVAMRYEPSENLFFGLTSNIAALAIATKQLAKDTVVQVALDGEGIGEFAVDGKELTFIRDPMGWHIAPPLPQTLKNPGRSGGFRSAFANRPILVYGTAGSPTENTWSLAKARYDAETILVRFNGSVDVISDTAFPTASEPNRNVILYGNADTNRAWPGLLSTSPIQVRRGQVQIDRRTESGDELACVFVRPRPHSPTAMVGVVSGTGIAGMRATDRLPYFVNGVHYPDLLLFSAECLTTGDDDIRAIGYFGLAWTVKPGEIVWRDAAL